MIDFIAENKEKLNINIEKLSWPDKYNIPVTDIELSFSLDGQRYIGRGTSFDSNLSLKKALSEAVERYMVKTLKMVNSNGVAVHPDIIFAKEFAANELIERDLFLCHYLTNTPMKLISPEKIDNNSQMILDFLEELGIGVKIFQMGTVNKNAICVILDGRKSITNKFGVIVGSNCGNELENSIKKAMLETLIDFISVIENGVRNISLDEFNQLDYIFPEDHLRLARDIDYANSYFNIFKDQSRDFLINSDSNSMSEISINEIKIDNRFDELGLKMFQAKSDQLQPLYFGKTRMEYINMERLKNFKNNSFLVEDINKLPHPFG